MKVQRVATCVGVLAVLVLALAAAACGGSSDDSGNAASTAAETAVEEPSSETAAATGEPADTGAETAAAAPSIDLRVGVVSPLTGPLSVIGPGLAKASEVAVAVIGEALAEAAVDDTVSVTLAGTEDTQGNATAAVEAATKLATTADIDVLVGSCATRETIPVAQSVTVRRQIVQISMCSTAPELSSLADDGYAWQMIVPNTVFAAAFVRAAQDAFGPTATVNVGSINDAGNGGLRKAFEEEWEAAGGTVGESVAWNVDQPTFDTEAQKLVSGDPDGWLIIDTPEDFAKLGPALVRTGEWAPDRTLVLEVFRDAKLLNDLGDPATKGLRGVSPTNEGSPSKDAFDAAFARLAPDVEPTGFEPLGFDPVILSFLAALRAGSDDPAKIRESLVAVSGPPGIEVTADDLPQAIEAILAGEEIDYQGAWSNTDWDENGDPASGLFEIWQYEGGGADIAPGEVVNVSGAETDG